jgi:putative hydrolase of the HAD superfamily
LRPRALLFDLDDTLLRTHEGHQAAMDAACARAAAAHPGWTPDAIRGAVQRTYSLLEARMEAGRVRFGSHALFRQAVWSETLRENGVEPDLGEELAEVYIRTRRTHYHLYPDVPRMLDQFAEEYTLVLVTNGLSDLQREKIEAAGIPRWFDRILVSGEVGSWKPDPGIFHRALALAETPPEAALMIGDSLAKDIAGARAAGIPGVWMRRYRHLQPEPGIEPVGEVADLPALDCWIAGMAGAPASENGR